MLSSINSDVAGDLRDKGLMEFVFTVPPKRTPEGTALWSVLPELVCQYCQFARCPALILEVLINREDTGSIKQSGEWGERLNSST